MCISNGRLLGMEPAGVRENHKVSPILNGSLSHVLIPTLRAAWESLVREWVATADTRKYVLFQVQSSLFVLRFPQNPDSQPHEQDEKRPRQFAVPQECGLCIDGSLQNKGAHSEQCAQNTDDDAGFYRAGPGVARFQDGVSERDWHACSVPHRLLHTKTPANRRVLV